MDQSSAADANRLFPTTSSFVVFWSYISLFVSQGLLVTAVQRSRIEGFNAVIVVLLVELTKLLICITIYLLRSPYEAGLKGAFRDLHNDIKTNQRLLLLYLVPAFLYCLYNNLTFINLSLFDVSTYYCLMQFRIVLTAVIYQVLFRRQLTLIQWASLLILTVGCLVKEYGMLRAALPPPPPPQQHNQNSTQVVLDQTQTTTRPNNQEPSGHDSEHTHFARLLWSTSLILLQMFCSCFAGVYNEYLLKDSATSKGADIILQNIFMYLDSIVCNLIAFKFTAIYSGDSKLIFGDLKLSSTLYNMLTSPLVYLLILNNAISGLVASFFLKSLNSILKTFASALELFAVTLLAWLLFNDKVDAHTILALALVSVATMIYSRNPVSVAPPAKLARVENRDGFVPLPMTGAR